MKKEVMDRCNGLQKNNPVSYETGLFFWTIY